MDASAFSLLILCFAGLSIQFPQSDLQTLDVAAESSKNYTNNANSTVAVACATARGLAGSCVDRQFCEYSTPAIDLTLYAPKGYKKLCAEKETCCPPSFQIRVETNKNTWEDKDISFDDIK